MWPEAASLCLESLEKPDARQVSDPTPQLVNNTGRGAWPTRTRTTQWRFVGAQLHGGGRSLLPWLFLAHLGTVAHSCPPLCQCYGNATVFCSEEGLAHVPEGIPANATQLFFVETSLGSIVSGAFANSSASASLRKLVFLCSPLRSLGEGAFVGLPGLRELDISSSLLTGLSGETFRGLAGLSILSLKFSPLETLEEGLFRNIPALRALHLQGNRIRALPPGIFHPVRGLETLSLAQNGLASLPGRVFVPVPHLRVLRLSDNNISSLPAKVFLPLRDLRELFLDGNALAELPAGVFSQQSHMQRLHLQYNALRGLRTTVFSSLANLTFLHLDGNRLAELPEGLFEGTPRLVELSVAHNQLETLPEGLFATLLHLSVLSLSHNRLHHLPAGLFQGLPALTRLQLHHNNLSGLPQGVLANLSSLEALDLSHNRLTTLPEGIFDFNFALFYVALGHNPWACDCHLGYLADWLRYADDLVNAQALCRSPANLQGLSLPGVRKEQLVCPRRPPGSARCRTETEDPSKEASTLPQCAYQDAEGGFQLTCDPGTCHHLSLTLPPDNGGLPGAGQHFSGNWTLDNGCGVLRVQVSVTIEKETPLAGQEAMAAPESVETP
ncbi:hypothetical protein JD844_008012 [Phrynosoma platyrhinos]|uniref:Carboxypeptidase N subunit 2 n=1 Tax=Phrynosoma platyrhinos TaxID=52577 RepID=A0ABQ7T4U6_PHRPL|nr:hypothetical protein JD844_008012 [Phrynosoma platyrhinos]